MTPQAFAEMINGRQYGDEVTKEEQRLAKEHGLVVVFGYSDDGVEFRGAIHDEAGANDAKGKAIKFTRAGKLLEEPDRDEREVLEKFGALEQVLNGPDTASVRVWWCHEKDGPCWTFEASFPHATFEVKDDDLDVLFCRGLVFKLEDAFKAKDGA